MNKHKMKKKPRLKMYIIINRYKSINKIINKINY